MTHNRGLNLADDLGFQRREWIAERVGWLLILAIICTAALGVFANGLFGQGTVTGSGGRLQLDYQRFARDGGTTELRVRVAPAAADAKAVEIWIGNSYLEANLIEQVVPEPETWVSSRNGAVLRFEAEGTAPFVAAFKLRPDMVGPREGEMALSNDPPVRFAQFFYP